MATSRVRAGASGYSFKEWKGTFYPDKIKPEEMLPFYSERLPTVEINNTFYRMPKASVLENWAATTPDDFRFAIKASRRITHISRIKVESCADSVDFLYRTLASLGAKRGPVLFQLPPNLKKDLPRLTAFLALLPEGHRAAFEFRNDTWFADDVYDCPRRAPARRCACPSARTTPRLPWWKPRRGATSACDSKRTRMTTSSNGRAASRRRRGATSTSTSCTSRPRRHTRRALMQFAPS